jgi:leucine rich repeat protein
MKKIYWLLLAAFLLTLMVAGKEPVYADTAINVSKPSLENRAIQNLKVIVKDDQSRKLRVDFILVDYMDRNINLTRIEKKSSSKYPVEFDGYTKIAELPYAVKICVWDIDTDKIIKEVSVPIKGGYYKEKVEKVQELKFEVRQFEKYTLPKTAKAVLNNGKSAKVNLDFKGALLDTSVAKEIKLPVRVYSDKYEYSEEMEAVFTIIPMKKIKNIPEITVRLKKGEDYKLPDTVEVVYEDETRDRQAVKWSGTFDKDTVKVYEIKGSVQGTELKAKIVITVEEFNPNAKYSFVDKAVGDAAADKLNKKVTEITYSDLLTIRDLSLTWYSEINLVDIKEMKNLVTLDLSYNQISDITPLSGLKKLKTLNLFSNKISSIDALAGLTELEEVNLGENLFSDISPLKGLTGLKKLNLVCKNVEDIRDLRYTDGLKELMLGSKVRDLTPIVKYNHNLAKPFDIKLLTVEDGSIVLNAQVGESFYLPYAVKKDGEIIFVNWEKISGEVEEHLEITGHFDGQTITARFSGENDRDSEIIRFKDKVFEEVIRYSVDKPYGDILFEDVKNLQVLDLAFKEVKDLSGLEYLVGLKKLGLYGIRVTDKELKVINTMLRLEELDLANCGISYVGEHAFDKLKNLREIVLDENPGIQIDKNAFAQNTSLEDFMAEDCGIYNLDCLKNVTSIKSVFAQNNHLRSLDALANLTKINYLALNENQITDISGLKGKSLITHLMMNNNPVSNISVLADMPLLNTFYLKKGRLTSVDALKDLKKLEVVYLDDNQIEDISAFRNSPMLRQLTLVNNRVRVVEPLKELKTLKVLHLRGNPVVDILVLKDIYDGLTNKDFYLP